MVFILDLLNEESKCSEGEVDHEELLVFVVCVVVRHQAFEHFLEQLLQESGLRTVVDQKEQEELGQDLGLKVPQGIILNVRPDQAVTELLHKLKVMGLTEHTLNPVFIVHQIIQAKRRQEGKRELIVYERDSRLRIDLKLILR